jgi:hypothetical protein
MTAVDTFLISLPEGWSQIPADPAALVAWIEAAASAAGPDRAADLEFRRGLLALRRLAEQAGRGGAVLTAVFAETLTDDIGLRGDEHEQRAPYHLAAICQLVTVPASRTSSGRMTFEQLQLAVSPEPREPGVARASKPQVVQLTGGPAIRDVMVRSVVVERGERIDVLECRYHSIIGSGEGMAVLAFSTPNVELADDLLALFEAIADTLEFAAA